MKGSCFLEAAWVVWEISVLSLFPIQGFYQHQIHSDWKYDGRQDWLAGVQFETANTCHKWETTEAVQKGVVILTSTPASLLRSMSTL